MERRDCSKVIREIISKIPEDKKEFIEDLEWNYDDSIYKAPEEVIQWSRTYDTICKHIPTLEKTGNLKFYQFGHVLM